MSTILAKNKHTVYMSIIGVLLGLILIGIGVFIGEWIRSGNLNMPIVPGSPRTAVNQTTMP